ncbi:hypothetical protein HS088_TW20G00507 [Tripterygium wilfordii]|uniref:Mitochondrial outer membrane protein porin of 36 kDa-like n=1 Tax=Tripterygium wilfordii TaxID=458696 RepID=A0A7J7C8G9_TRIWF|nr:mitochondrial outer membrane protein porin of 36 kDa-like [Tripterygium wilfordii]KAF5730137.1 hypothetical protein HS088_TW20G00507 [Tripterygium wilfordii]
MNSSPGIYFDIGKKARDVLYKDYAQLSPLHFQYQCFKYNCKLSCHVGEVLPGLGTLFRVIIPDSGKAELRYLHEYAGIAAGVGLKPNPTGGCDAIADFSGALGSDLFSIGTNISFDISTRTFNNLDTGLSLNTAFLTASLTLDDKFDTLKASCYHSFNPLSKTAVAAEFWHSFSTNTTGVALGTQHALWPFTLVKARVDSSWKIGTLVRQELWQRFFIAIAGEVDFMAINKLSKLGFSVGFNL